MKPSFQITGIVKEGKKRGKRIGFPTINIPLIDKIPEGIYISQTEITGKKYNSLTFVGAAKTYNETNIQSETYILQYDTNLYGQYVTVNLLKKIRDNQTFASEEELIKQMERDKIQAINFFSENGK